MSIKITDQMIPMDQVSAKLVIESGKSESDYLLTDLKTILETTDKKPRERLPILDHQDHIKYIAHRSLIDRFVSEKLGDPKVLNLTLKDLVDNTKAKLEAFGVLPPTANLADAKFLIDNTTDCSDVFVTEEGARDTKVLGWITNVDILKIAQLE